MGNMCPRIYVRVGNVLLLRGNVGGQDFLERELRARDRAEMALKQLQAPPAAPLRFEMCSGSEAGSYQRPTDAFSTGGEAGEDEAAGRPGPRLAPPPIWGYNPV